MSVAHAVSADEGGVPSGRIIAPGFYQRFLPFFVLFYLGASLYFFTWAGLRDQVSLFGRLLWFSLLIPSAAIIFSNLKSYTQFVLSNKMLLLIIAWFTLTALWSPLPSYTIKRVFFYLIVLTSLSALVFAADSIRTFHRQLVKVSILFVLLSFASLYLTPQQAITSLGFAGIFDHKNTAGAWTFIMVFAILFADMRNRWIHAGLLKGLLLGLLAGFLVMTESKTSMGIVAGLTLFYSVTILFWKRGPQLRILYNSLLLLLVLGFLAYWYYNSFELAPWVYENFGTFTGRDKLWTAAGHFIDKHFWLGYGYGAFWDIDDNPEPMMSLYGFWHYVYINQFHNGYIELRVQTGMVGLLLLLLYISRSLYMCYYLLSRSSQEEHGRSASMIFVILLGIMINNLTESTFFMASHFQGVLFVWFSLWLERLVREEKLRQRAVSTPA